MKSMILGSLFLLSAVFSAAAQGMSYVIKVTPTLVYVDTGIEDGVQIGDQHVVVREAGNSYVSVADVSVLRTFPGFSIAEIVTRNEKQDVAILQRSLPLEDWQKIVSNQLNTSRIEEAVLENSAHEKAFNKKRSVNMLFGIDSGRESDVRWSNGGVLLNSKSKSVSSIGIRLSQSLSRNLGMALTYRSSSDDMKNLSIEGDVHWVFRGYDQFGPYIGLGLGLAQLSIQPPEGSEANSSTNKIALNTVCGLNIPGNWIASIELGYQYVAPWGAMDASSVRSYIGLGRSF